MILAWTLTLASSAAPADALSTHLEQLYLELHQAPELSTHEEQTSARMAAELTALGFEVTTKVGGWGVVGVLKNGPGKTLLIRTDMDGLPVDEKTGVSYASKATALDPNSLRVGVMHACGHDLHMTTWVGAAATLARDKRSWHGTLVFIAQPAEELVLGAKAMIADGLFTRFPKPDFTIALHDNASLPSDAVAFVRGPAFAAVDTVSITLYGKGGHGAAPQTTVDPIVLAAKVVLSLQTLVSRELKPIDSAVVTVGSIHGGTKSNIIPDEVRLELTVRSYKPSVRQKLREGIARIVKGEAEASNAPKPPRVTIEEGPVPVSNDGALIDRLLPAMKRALGEKGVVEFEPVMGSEDFGEYATVAHVPGLMLWLGATDATKLAELKRADQQPPSTHSSLFLPDYVKAIPTGVTALATAARTLLSQ